MFEEITAYIMNNYDTDKEVDLDTLYNHVKKHDFILKDIGEGKNDIEFFKDKDDWICWCCGKIRVMIKNRVICIPGIWYKEGIFSPNNEPCEHFNGEKCSLDKCVIERIERVI